MKALDFIRKLLPTFGKNDVREKLRLTLSKLTDLINPMIEDIGSMLQASNFKSTFGKAFNAAFLKFAPPHVRNHPDALFATVEKAKDNAILLGGMLTDHSVKYLKDTIHVEGITYQTVSLLRLIEVLEFFSDYTSRLLLRLVTAETNVSVFASDEAGDLSRAEIAWIENNRGSYFMVLELLYNDPKQLMAKLTSIPEIVVQEFGSVTPALQGGASDPLQLGVIPLLTPLFTGVGIRSVNRDIEKYERTKKERRAIEMRMEALRQSANGPIDARTQSIIEGYERELVLVRAKIAKMEGN